MTQLGTLALHRHGMNLTPAGETLGREPVTRADYELVVDLAARDRADAVGQQTTARHFIGNTSFGVGVGVIVVGIIGGIFLASGKALPAVFGYPHGDLAGAYIFLAAYLTFGFVRAPFRARKRNRLARARIFGATAAIAQAVDALDTLVPSNDTRDTDERTDVRG